jgi:hypothetical protein
LILCSVGWIDVALIDSNLIVLSPPKSSAGQVVLTAAIMGWGGKVSDLKWPTAALLCFVNLINYMDRYTVAGE